MLLSGRALSPGGLLSIGANVPGELWTPLAEPTLSFWLDATDSSTLTTSGSSVTKWKDKKTETVEFSYDGAGTVNLSSGFVSFNSGSMTALSRFGIPANSDLTLAIVCNPNITGDNKRVVSVGGGGGAGNLRLAVSSQGTSWRHDNGFAQFTPGGISQKSFLALTRTPGNYSTGTGRLNGSQLTRSGSNGGPPTQTAEDTTIGDVGWQGDIWEVFGFQTASQAIIEKLEGYASHKHGIAALLPSNHPYKNSPPAA